MNESEIVVIERVVLKGKKYLVYLQNSDEEHQFTEDQMVNYRIVKGAIILKKDWKKIVKSENTGKLFDQMLHFIDFKMRSKQEVVKKLLDKKADPNTIDEIIKRLEKIGYIDDERYTRMYIEESIRQSKGKYLIRYSLEQKGIDSKTIEKAMIKITDESEKDASLRVAKAYLRTINKYPSLKQKELLASKLSRQGYGMDIINYCIREIEFGEDSLDLLENEYQKLLLKTDDKNKIITSLLQKGYRYEDIKRILKTYDE